MIPWRQQLCKCVLWCMCAVWALWMFGPAGPSRLCAQEPGQEQEERRDSSSSIGTGGGDTLRTGVNAQGDSVTEIRRDPKAKQQPPVIGPIYVVPQVGSGQIQPGAPMPIPVPGRPVQPRAPGVK